jgi:hypothetical protein
VSFRQFSNSQFKNINTIRVTNVFHILYIYIYIINKCVFSIREQTGTYMILMSYKPRCNNRDFNRTTRVPTRIIVIFYCSIYRYQNYVLTRRVPSFVNITSTSSIFRCAFKTSAHNGCYKSFFPKSRTIAQP